MSVRRIETNATFTSDYAVDPVRVTISQDDKLDHIITITEVIDGRHQNGLELSAADFDRIVDEVERFRRAKRAANGEPCECGKDGVS